MHPRPDSSTGFPNGGKARFVGAGGAPGDPLDALDDLAGDPEEPAVFMEPWMFHPAVRHLAPRRGVDVMMLRDAAGALGFVPLIREPWPFLSPRAVTSVWVHPYCYDATPLVRAGRLDAFLDALFARLESDGVSVLRWPMLPLDTRFAAALMERLAARGQAHAILSAHSRPLLGCAGRSVDEFLAQTLSAKARRELNRVRRRLGEEGDLRVERNGPGADGDELARQFVELEASGWKGPDGCAGALAYRDARHLDYFMDMMRRGCAAGALAVFTLKLDDRPIAMSINAVSGRSMWGLRTAYDDALSARSPGVVVETEQAMASIADHAVDWVDACTDVINPTLERLYPERRTVADVMIATSPEAVRALRLSEAAERGYRTVRGLAKRAYHAAHPGLRH